MEQNKLLNISKRTFLSVVILLLALMALSIILTYAIPKGDFGEVDGVIDYSTYIARNDIKGINLFKGIFAPILVLTSSDGLSLIFLSIFLIVIMGVFQVLQDVNGINAIVGRVAEKFKNKRILFFVIITFIFMSFGAFLGLFEETLTLLPVVIILAISLGYDSFTGFLISLFACGMGFASSISNPFTVIFASNIIGVNPLINIWFRIMIFVIMYLFTLGIILLYVKKIKKNRDASFTLKHDELAFKDIKAEEVENGAKIRLIYLIFFAVVLAFLIVFSALSALRDYTIPALIVVYLFGGNLAGYLACKDFKLVMKSFGKGVVSALPTILLILMAASIKYILLEGHVIATISNQISLMIDGKNIYVVALIIYMIILVLEFFISSSTAKAIFVMGILSALSIGLSKEMLVLLYTFGDGYTNLFFPTSPVLLIGLSMIGFDYFKWIKKSWWIFILNIILVIGLICLGILVKY